MTEKPKRLGQARFIPIPPELLHYRGNLFHPSSDTLTKPFTPAAFKIMCYFFEVFNPKFFFNDVSDVPSELFYIDIEDHTNISVSTIQKYMPYLFHTFRGKYFRDVKKGFGESYTFRFVYDFALKADTEIKVTTVEDEINNFRQKLNEEDFVKFELYSKIKPLDQEQKRIKIFKDFQNRDISFWRRNIKEMQIGIIRHKWRAVPIRYLYDCLNKDYAYNKLDKKDQSKAIGNLNGFKQLKEHGINLDNILSKAN